MVIGTDPPGLNPLVVDNAQVSYLAPLIHGYLMRDDGRGRLDHVGCTATITNADRPALTRRLEAICEAPGFTGRAPGGPSRWKTERSGEWEALRPELVVEVRFDHVTGDRFRHGTKLIRWRPDKAPRQCTFDQIKAPLAEVGL